MNATLDQLQQLDQTEAALNAQVPSNSSQIADMQSFYGSLVASILTRLSTSYSTLVRAYAYYLRTDVDSFDLSPINDTLYTLNTQQVEALASDGVKTPVATVSVADQMQKLFDRYKDALSKMDQAVVDAYGKVMAGSKINETWRYGSSGTEDPVKRGFVLELQEKLNDLFARIAKQEGPTPNQASALINIPSYMFLDQQPQTPELVEEVFVGRLAISNAVTADAKIELIVNHPAYGDFVRSNKCYFVNFADATAAQNVLRFPALLRSDGSTDFGGPTDTSYAPFPLRTNFSLEIKVLRQRSDRDFTHWNPPVLSAVEVISKYIRY